MRHDGQPDLLGNLKRDIERRNAGRAAGVASDPHLDADDQVAVRVDDAYALTGIDEPQIGGLSDHDARTECKDAGKRDIEERQDAQRRGLDDMPPVAMKIARPDLPASTKVVVPLLRATSPASTPSEVPPQ